MPFQVGNSIIIQTKILRVAGVLEWLFSMAWSYLWGWSPGRREKWNLSLLGYWSGGGYAFNLSSFLSMREAAFQYGTRENWNFRNWLKISWTYVLNYFLTDKWKISGYKISFETESNAYCIIVFLLIWLAEVTSPKLWFYKHLIGQIGKEERILLSLLSKFFILLLTFAWPELEP